MKQLMGWIKVVAAMAVVTAMSGCASGPAFTAVEAAPAGQGQVYLYRTWQFQGSAANLKIYQDGAQIDKTIPNASWERVVVSPGRHTFGLTEYLNSMSCAGAQVDVAAGQTVFLSVDFSFIYPTGTAVSICQLLPRDEQQALKDIAGLKRSN